MTELSDPWGDAPAVEAGRPDVAGEVVVVDRGAAAEADGNTGEGPVTFAGHARRDVFRRTGRRLVRRPLAWMRAPWTTDRTVRVLTALFLVGGAVYAVMKVVHIELVFRDNTPTGGDMGAHVLGPAYLRDHLLPNLQLTGWSNDWYAGSPMYRFYMVVPALMIVALDVVLPYGIAFKIVVVLGLLTLPVCCWAFGRLARFRFPIPELMALGGMLFLFEESFDIYGGNVRSTMAGEFSFSIALSFAVLGLGLFARGLETGKYRSWSAIVLALAMLCHGIVLIFVVLGAALLWLLWMDRTRFTYGFTTLLTAGLLSAFWVVPFLFNHAYMTDMKYGGRPEGAADSFWDMFFPWPVFWDLFIVGFAIVGFVAAIVRRHLTGAWLGVCSIALMGAVYATRESLPLIGLLWNPRLLPFLYLLLYLLMMVGLYETAHSFVVATRAVRGRNPLRGLAETYFGAGVAGTIAIGVMVVMMFLFRIVPGGHMVTHNGQSVYKAGRLPISLTPTSKDALSDQWTQYNFTGYEGKAAYGEYRALVLTMAGLGEQPGHGCGRALWENNEATGQYGTTMALMLLPHWTDGCIGSMEGLFFEASGTTPYHFLTASAVSLNSSDPVRELRYEKSNTGRGVPYMQALGVKYLMVFTASAKEQAARQPDLTIVARSGPWEIYEVAGSELVEALEFQPVVANKRPGDQRERNLEMGTSWFQNQESWAAMPADDGPESWQRVDLAVDTSRSQPGRVEVVQPTTPIVPVELPDVVVSDVSLGKQDLRFKVDRVGVPVLVKMSYFPNWKVSGAQGPYRIAPNLMVVIPTDNDVHLTFERSATDVAAYALTLGGIGLLVLWRRRGDVLHHNLWADRLAGLAPTPPVGRPSFVQGSLDLDDGSMLDPTVPTVRSPDDALIEGDPAVVPRTDDPPGPYEGRADAASDQAIDTPGEVRRADGAPEAR